jgi:hypothetical protein
VPGDAASIQEAVDQARAGDIVLVEPGLYSESVTIERGGFTLRGADRNTVILDGGGQFANGIVVTADGVSVENLTVRNYQQNGIIFTGLLGTGYGTAGTEGRALDGYRVAWVTAYNNGLYGVYAFASTNGVIEHSYASGHPDSGFYVGQCRPCNVVLRNVTAERNAIGYFGTNASENVWVVESVFAHNRLGIAPNSQKAELLAPQAETIVAGNLVVDNDDPGAPEISDGFFGSGIALGGGVRNTVVRNRVEGHLGAGIAVMPLNDFLPEANRVEGNIMSSNGTDLVFLSTSGTQLGNCFVGNDFATSVPVGIESRLVCGASATVPTVFAFPVAPAGPSYRDVPAPPPQPTMPSARTAPPAVTGTPAYPSLESITVPARR